MLVNSVAVLFLATIFTYAIVLGMLVHHIAIGIFAWDAIRNPSTSPMLTIAWLAGFYLLWFFCMPAYIYLCSRETDEDFVA